MKTLPPGMQTHLDSGTTTLCLCWRLVRVSGETLGFTDHDCPIAFDGTVFEAAAGFSGSEIESSLGLSGDNLEASGALESARLDENRLRAGEFDHATVEIWRVNWSDVTQRVLLRRGHLGEVSYGDGAFHAEVRGLAHLLGQTRGRIYQHGCDAELGGARCAADISAAAFSATGNVLAVEGEILTVGGISTVEDWFTRGTAAFLSGAATGKTWRIKRQRLSGGALRVTLWQRPPVPIAIADSVKLTAGCDKQFATCCAKFANGVNFRGFPHMPGNDFLSRGAHQGDIANTGGRIV